MGKNTTFRVSSEQERMLGGLYAWNNYTPSQTINEAIEVTPEVYLSRKPTQMHIQLSDRAVKKLNKAAKKHNLSNATLIERAIDCYYKLTTEKQVQNIADKVDEIYEKGERPFHSSISGEMHTLLRAVLPLLIRYHDYKPHWSLSDDPSTYLALNPH